MFGVYARTHTNEFARAFLRVRRATTARAPVDNTKISDAPLEEREKEKESEHVLPFCSTTNRNYPRDGKASRVGGCFVANIRQRGLVRSHNEG